jgi:coenzyme PQQ biosynthesis protein PqqD
MAAPNDSSKPRLAAGCRWAAENRPAENRSTQKKTGTDETRVILFPEGAIKLQGTGRQVLEHCDGIRTFGEIIAELQSQFKDTDAQKIRGDISTFLEQLQKKRIVDY